MAKVGVKGLTIACKISLDIVS